MCSRLMMLIVLLIVTSALSQAQIFSRCGIKVGLNMSDITITDRHPADIGGVSQDVDYVQGATFNPAISLFVDPVRSERLDLEVELSWVRSGARRTTEIVYYNPPDFTTSTATNVTNELGLYYLRLGFNAEPKYSLGGVTVYATVGPTVNYLLSVTDLVATDDQLNRLLIGYTLGLGAVMPGVFNRDFFVEIKYGSDSKYFYKGYYAHFWNRTWLLNVGAEL